MTLTAVLCDSFNDAEALYAMFVDTMWLMDPQFIIEESPPSLSVKDDTGNQTIFVDRNLYRMRNQLGLTPDHIINAHRFRYDLLELQDGFFGVQDLKYD